MTTTDKIKALTEALSAAKDCMSAASDQLTKKHAKELNGKKWGWWYIDLANSALAAVQAPAEVELVAGDAAVLLVDAVWKPCVHGGGWWVTTDADGRAILLPSETPLYTRPPADDTEAMRAEVERLTARVAELEAQPITAQDAARVPEIAALIEAIANLMSVFPDPCRYDHHGKCQEHFIEDDCSVAKTKAALRAIAESRDGESGASRAL